MSSHRLEASGTSESTNNNSSQTPNRRAPVWEYYEPDLVEIDGVLKAICKYCGTKLTANRKSGTNSLRTHIAEHCPTIPSDDRNKFVATMKKKPVDSSFTFNQQRSRDLMIAWCVRADVAFNKFDDEGFEPWMESLQPAFRCIGRQMIRNECVAKFERAKIELRSELQSLNSRICFTSDLWTSNQKLGYICVTAHYIGPDFVLKKKIIAFKDLKYPHTGVAIEEAITTILTDYGIKEKMFTITLDNVANNKAACDLLQESGKFEMLFGGEHLLVRCCAHILNILVQDGMNIVSAMIELIRDLIRHINSSPSRIQDFNEIAQRECLAAKAGLVLDVPNRWNSTHAMIMEAVKYKIVLKRYAQANQQPFPTEDEFSKVEYIGEFLGVFEETTRAFSADRYATSHMFLDNVLCIHQTLNSPEWYKDEVIADLAKAMERKFDKYWNGNYNMVLVICSILDPRTKVDFLDFFYEKVCRNFIDIDLSKNQAKEWLRLYFRKYEEVIRQNDTNVVSQTGASRSMVNRSPVLVLGKRRLEQEFAEYRHQRRGTWIEKSELDAYLDEPPVRTDENFEILTWWKTNSNKYPVLSAMARDFLAIPLSTVSSESAFSLSGRILSDNRSSMTPETLEALVCCKDWLYKYPTDEAT
ncbi:zinc finger BED domain-containing protein RICESLEEPER 2-like [Setaria viridis]|uniref:zinc finger BED domain-containing protein RICESLEEPER 2-like n=1 Tax=Setaria viridis TaxID=4556 RepID=UPI0014934217|nr:zinc finger BED domain-containing protein RICESLEEPER 2-like [Setaria viridis]